MRGDKRHGYAPRIVTHTPATDTQAAQEGSAAAGAEATEKKFTNAKDAKDAQKLAKQQRVDIAARGSKQRDKAHIRKTKSVPFSYEYGSYDLEVPYTEIKLSDTPGVGPNAPFHDYNTEGPKCDPKEGLKPLIQPSTAPYMDMMITIGTTMEQDTQITFSGHCLPVLPDK